MPVLPAERLPDTQPTKSNSVSCELGRSFFSEHDNRIFGCYTGRRFSDFLTVEVTHPVKNEDNRMKRVGGSTDERLEELVMFGCSLCFAAVRSQARACQR